MQDDIDTGTVTAHQDIDARGSAEVQGNRLVGGGASPAKGPEYKRSCSGPTLFSGHTYVALDNQVQHGYSVDMTLRTTQKPTPNNHFHPCCDRRNVLPHALHCWTRDQAYAAELAQCGPVKVEQKPDVLVVTGGNPLMRGRAALRRQWVARVLVAFHPAEVQEDTSHGQGATVVFRFPLSGHVAKVAYAEHDPSDVVAEIRRRGLVGEP